MIDYSPLCMYIILYSANYNIYLINIMFRHSGCPVNMYHYHAYILYCMYILHVVYSACHFMWLMLYKLDHELCNHLQPSLMSALVLRIMAALQDGHALEEANNPFPCIQWTISISETGCKITGPSSRIDIFRKNRRKSKVINTSRILHMSVYAQ